MTSRKYISFQAKVLIPVVAIMVMLLAITGWTANRRISKQLEAQAVGALETSEAVFKNSEKIRANNLLLRFGNVPNEPRFRAVLDTGDEETIRFHLGEVLRECKGELALFTTESGSRLASAKRQPLLKREHRLDLIEFETASSVSVDEALRGEPNVYTIRVSERLFDVVSLPVTIGTDNIIGALTFGVEIGEAVAEEFSQITHSGIVFLVNNHVVASSLKTPDLERQLSPLFSGLATGPSKPTRAGYDRTHSVSIGSEQFLWRIGKFNATSGDTKLRYLLLSSYEQPLSELKATRRMLLLASSLGILLGTLVVWSLARKITQPLRRLRDTAEAVGGGDFSRRVEVSSNDECGELAEVFNRMTDNLQNSHGELETTVNRLKSTQAQLIQSEKLSAIGEFVAGVTHELNNPLTSLIGFTELLQQSGANPVQQRFLDRIVQSAERCHKIVQSLLSFARQHPPERKLISLNQLIEAAVEILNYEMRTSNIQVITTLDPCLPRLMADPHQLQQVFLNIINNGRQAMEAHQPKGWIRIESEASNGRVRVRFQDNGPGISKENLAKIFNPFFTTKESGKGTGLGLSLSYGIIQEHGGNITAQSEEGNGATFIVELPVTREVPENSKEAPLPLRPEIIQGNGKKVLVVDDEEPILDLIRDILSNSGFQVDTVPNGEEALRCLRQTKYDLTVCDWKMPGLNGRQVYESLSTNDRSAAEKFIFMTGDIINEKTQQFLLDSKSVCLSKPFSLDEFRSAISGVLQKA